MMVWWNGRFCSLQEVRISLLDRGFLFGDGVFETMRVERGVPLWLEDHLHRLRSSLAYFRIKNDLFQDVPKVRSIIHELSYLNPAIGDVARLKIIVTRGKRDSFLGLPEVTDHLEATTIFMMSSYEPPKEEEYQEGWDLWVLEKGFAPFLGSHKTLNYLFYLWARDQARSRGAYEVLIPDFQGYIIEASTANIIGRDKELWVISESSFKLPGITEKRITKILTARGDRVVTARLTWKDLLNFQGLWLLNSLLGAMPARSINNTSLVVDCKGTAYLREALFKET